MSKKVVIVGLGEIAEMAAEYFTIDSDYEVVAFTAEADYIKLKMTDSSFCGRPVVPIENMLHDYPCTEYKMFIALAYSKLNHERARIYNAVKKMGYVCVNYISSGAFIGPNVSIGENCFILENNVLQRNVHIGNDVTLWSGNHIGHGSSIGNHVFLSSHVAISGHCTIGDYSFMGINSCLGDHVRVAENCWISSGVTLLKDTSANEIYRLPQIKPERLKADMVFGF